MPFVRVSRDKRGYEHIYLVHAATRRGKPSRPCILYWFRTPPGVIVGREPFDQSVRRALEAQNPGVTFEWDKLVKMALSPPDVEPWRERRRTERAAKQARLAGDQDQGETAALADGEETFLPPLALDSPRAPARHAEGPEKREGADPGDRSELAALAPVPLAWPEHAGEEGRRSPEGPQGTEIDGPHDDIDRKDSEAQSGGVREEPAEGSAVVAALAGNDAQQPQRRRRRRRGGRRRRPSGGSEATPTEMRPNSPKGEEPVG